MRTLSQAAEFGALASQYAALRAGMQYRAKDVVAFLRDPDVCQNVEQFVCRHDWAINEESDRCYCLNCGKDGDA